MYQPHPVTDEQKEEILSALLSYLPASGPATDADAAELDARYQRACAGIYPYHPLVTTSIYAFSREVRIRFGGSGDRKKDKIAFVYNVWVFYGDLRSCWKVQETIASVMFGYSSVATCYMHLLFDKYIERSVRQQRALPMKAINRFSSHLMRKYSTQNNKSPRINRDKHGLYDMEFWGPFCPVEDSGEPTQLVTCDYCGTNTASLVIDPEGVEGSFFWKYEGPPETWDSFKLKSWENATCGGPLCEEVEAFTSRKEQYKRIAKLTSEPLKAPTAATIKKVPEEFRPAFKMAKYVDFVARVEQRTHALGQQSDAGR